VVVVDDARELPGRCTVHGIAGKTDDPRDWWPIRARSCASLSYKVTRGSARVIGCRVLRRGRIAVGIAAGKKKSGAVTPANANVAYALRLTAR
jgi:hypothetical protein